MKTGYYYITDHATSRVYENQPYVAEISCHQGYLNTINHMVQYAIGTMHKEQSPGVTGIDMILTGKKELIRSKIELLLIQLSQRKVINYNIFTGIDSDSCKLQGLIFQMGDKAYLLDKSRIQVEKMKFDLEREKRMEQASYFRDTAMLNKDLKDALIDYIKERQNERLFGD